MVMGGSMGKKYGKKDTVMMAISNVNNEQKLNGVKFQSLKKKCGLFTFFITRTAVKTLSLTLEMVMVDQVYAHLHVKLL